MQFSQPTVTFLREKIIPQITEMLNTVSPQKNRWERLCQFLVQSWDILNEQIVHGNELWLCSFKMGYGPGKLAKVLPAKFAQV